MTCVTILVTHALSNEYMEDGKAHPLTPREQFEKEITECREWKDDNPELWKILFKEEIDAETFAFYVLPNETKEKLWN